MRGKVSNAGYRPTNLVRTIRAVPAPGGGFVGQIMAGRLVQASTPVFVASREARAAAVSLDSTRVKEGAAWPALILEDNRIDIDDPCVECRGQGTVLVDDPMPPCMKMIRISCASCGGSAVRS